MPEPTIEEIKSLVSELKNEYKNNSKNYVKIDYLNDKISEVDEKNAAKDAEIKALSDSKDKIDIKLAELKTHSDAQLKRIEAFEVSKAFAMSGKEDFRQTKEYEALMASFKNIATPEQKALMRTDSDVDGGFTVLDERARRILENQIVTSPIRQLATVQRTTSKVLEFVKVTNEIESYYEGEAEQSNEDGLEFGVESLTANAQTIEIPITQEMLMNSDLNIENLLMRRAAQYFEKKTNQLCVVGDGVKKPEGFLVNADVVANHQTTSTTSGIITFDDINDLAAKPDSNYNFRYLGNRRTIAKMRGLKDAGGALIWQQGIGEGVSNTIKGELYTIIPDMPDIASNAVALAYADLKEAYVITERSIMDVLRNPFSKSGKRIVIFTFSRWNTGKVVLAEAIETLKIKA